MGDTKILTVTGAGGGVVLAAARGGGGGGGSRLVCMHPRRSERDGNNRRAKQNNKTQRLSTTQAANLAQSCPQSAPRPPPPPPPVILDLSNEVSARARTSTNVAHPPEDNSLPLRLTAAGLPGPYRASWGVVVVVLVDHLRERQEETQLADRRARTSSRCLAAPRPACETIRLMGFWSIRALRSAWFGRRRTHLLAKHGAVVVLQDGPGGQES